MALTDDLLSSINQNISSVVRASGDVSIGFFNDAAIATFVKGVEEGTLEALNKHDTKEISNANKIYEKGKKDSQKNAGTVAAEIKKSTNKLIDENKKAIEKNGGALGRKLSEFNDVANLFRKGSDKFARNLFIASKSFEIGTGILKKVFQASVSYMDAAKDLSDAGLMIGSTTNMLYKTAEGTYKRFSDGTTDFNAIITHSANLAGIRLEDFGDKLKENSSFLTRMYSMGVEGTAELGNLYATVAKRAGDMSQRNADTVVKQWAGAIQPLYTTEEIMSNKLNTSFDNLVETMNYFMKATGKSAENILKENEIKEKTLALERITAENPQIVSALKSVGYSDDMIMGALTGRITKELNMQLMNSPNFAAGFRNVQQMIQQHATDGYLNTDEGRRLFANAVLASANNAQTDIRNIRNMSDYLTRRTYAGYDYIRQIEAVGRIRTNAINPNATILGQNSSQTRAVEAANEFNRNTNRVVNDIKDLLSPGMKNLARIQEGMAKVTGAIDSILPNSLTSPITNALIGGGIQLLGTGLAVGSSIWMAKSILGGGLFKSGLAASGAGAQTAGGIPLSSALIRSATAKTALATTGRALGAGASAAIAGYNLYDEWETSSKTKKTAQWASLLLGLGGLIAAPFSGGLSLALTAGSIGTGALSGFLPDKAGSQLEQSVRRGSTEGQPYYFNSPEIVNKLNQIQTVCQSLYGVACANRQMNTFARMDAVSASNK